MPETSNPRAALPYAGSRDEKSAFISAYGAAPSKSDCALPCARTSGAGDERRDV